MESNFFAYLSRMKLIKRWSLMRNIQQENIAEHSHQVAVIAHGLAVIANKYFDGALDVGKVALLAIYHDAGEVIIGDLPTPVKYYNPEIKASYGEIEDIAKEKLLSFLPAELADDYQSLFFADETSHEARIVKAADKLSAYVKCLEELAAGNKEFAKACGSIAEELKKYAEMPEVAWFMEHCLSGFSKTLDELG
ncbi:MAG: 5'-deoxynucleotidase [Firmicutes bacterium]|nr:5'-deoxynucleotidase [Bacillota bacterium]